MDKDELRACFARAMLLGLLDTDALKASSRAASNGAPPCGWCARSWTSSLGDRARDVAACTWVMARPRVDATIDEELLCRARTLRPGLADEALVDEALSAL